MVNGNGSPTNRSGTDHDIPLTDSRTVLTARFEVRESGFCVHGNI